MKKQLYYQDLKMIDYQNAWDYQEKLHAEVVNAKIIEHAEIIPGYLLFCEHPHVYTLGKSGTETNLLINEQFLKSIDATFFRINRGGDITYHGPGQIVGYPIIDLENYNLSVKKYIHKIEESIIRLLDQYDVSGERLDDATGVWVKCEGPQKFKKVCAIGVRVSRYVTMHGFALNVNTNLQYFNYINPCGFTDKGVTSMAELTEKPVNFNEVKSKLIQIIEKEFDASVIAQEVHSL